MCTQIRPPIIWAVLSGFTLFDQDASKMFQQTTKADNNFVIAAKELKKVGVVYLLPTNNKMLLSACTCRSICFYTG